MAEPGLELGLPSSMPMASATPSFSQSHGATLCLQSEPSQKVAFPKAAYSSHSEPGHPLPRTLYCLPGGRAGDQFQSATEER